MTSGWTTIISSSQRVLSGCGRRSPWFNRGTSPRCLTHITPRPYTWISCIMTSRDRGLTHHIGRLHLEGNNLTFRNLHTGFVEVYSTARIPRTGIPEMKAAFRHSSVNGQVPSLKYVCVQHTGHGERSKSPDRTTAAADNSEVAGFIGPIFERDPNDRGPLLEVKDLRKRATRNVEKSRPE